MRLREISMRVSQFSQQDVNLLRGRPSQIDFFRYYEFGLKRNWRPEVRFLSGTILLVLLCFRPLVANDNIVIPIDQFSGITLDEPVVGRFYTYTPIHVSGTVTDPWVSEIRFVLRYNEAENVDACGTFNSYTVLVQNGKFNHTFFFSNEQADDYLLLLWTKKGVARFSSSGVFRPFIVQRSGKTSPIPVTFFSNIEFASPIPVEFTTGQAVRVSGTVFDPSLTMVGLSFLQEDVDYRLKHWAPVIDGQFNKTLFFAHKTAGVYHLELWRFQGNLQNADPQDVFSPIKIKRGEGNAFLPFDYFEEITLTSPMPVLYSPGQSVRITGTVSDPSVSYIEFLLSLPEGYLGQSRRTENANFKSAVENGQFTIKMDFSSEQQPGDYWLDVFLHRRGNRSLGPRRFRPITIEAPRSPDFDGNGTVRFPDFILFARAFGTSSADEDFDLRFDLNGDGTVDFGDFLIFAKSFGQ